MKFTDKAIEDKWKRTGELLRKGSTNFNKSIDEMNLSEALEAERKFLKWYDENPTHEDRVVKKHIYEMYLKPRILELQTFIN